MKFIQNKEMCDYYAPKGIAKNYNPVYKYFNGNSKDKVQLSRCRKYCSIMECKETMGARHYKRHKGAIK